MATVVPLIKDFSCEYGVIETVSPLIRRIVARNPGPFTFKGTGTYVIGTGRVAVIDPGPDLEEHVEALLGALNAEEITHIPVTHTHIDHSPASGPVRAASGAKTFAFGPHGSGKASDGITVEEGGDHEFVPDVELRHGDVIEGDGWTLECVYTPGHTSNHLCYRLAEENALFSGDHVMGWSTTVVSPPDGDMGEYMASLRMLLDRDEGIYWPTHGAPIRDPKPFLAALIAHREEREEQIADCMARGIVQIPDMVAEMYKPLDPRLVPAARRSVFAHMIHMVETDRAACDGTPAEDSRYRPAKRSGK